MHHSSSWLRIREKSEKVCNKLEIQLTANKKSHWVDRWKVLIVSWHWYYHPLTPLTSSSPQCLQLRPMVLVKVFMNYNYNQDNTLVQPITFKHRLDQRKFQFFMMCGADEKICPGPIRRPDWTVTLFDVFDLQEVVVDSKTNSQNRWSLRCFCSQNLQLVQGQRWTQGNQVFVEILNQHWTLEHLIF